MRKFIVFLLFFVLVTIPLYAVVIDEIVATVNGEPITLVELERILQPVYKRYEQVLKNEQLKQAKIHARRELLNQLIENELILQKAKEEGISISEAAMEEQLAEVKEKFGSLEEFEKALKREGLDLKQYKEELKDQLTVRAMIEREVMPKAKVSPETIALYYEEHKEEMQTPEEVHLMHILEKKSRKDVDGKYKRLETGEDLKDEWTDLGFLPIDRLKPELKEVVESLEIDQYSSVIETGVGYYIILLKDRKPPRNYPLSEVWDKLEDKLFSIKMRQEHKKWVDTLKSKAHIEISQ